MSAYAKHQKIEESATRREAAAHVEWLRTDEGLEAQADMATERATRNFLSYDSEAFAEMVREDLAL